MSNVENKWLQFTKELQTKSEDELIAMINQEIIVGGRESSLVRMHMRYAKLRTMRERRDILNGILI